jgi:hypothetical protein
MPSKKTMGFAIASLLLILGLCSSLRPDDPVIVPVKVIGYVAYCEGYLDMMIDVTQGGRKMSGLEVKLNGQLATATTSVSYNYKCVIHGARPAAGDAVKLTIAKPPLVPGGRVTPFVTATGTITSLLELTAPVDGDTIPATAAGVDVSYSGGDTPYRLSICKVLAGNRCGRVNFPGCPGMSCTVPMILFQPGWSYSFNLFAPIGSIRLAGPLHPDSHIILRQHHSHTITIGGPRL